MRRRREHLRALAMAGASVGGLTFEAQVGSRLPCIDKFQLQNDTPQGMRSIPPLLLTLDLIPGHLQN